MRAQQALTMLRRVSTMPACVAWPWLPIPTIVGTALPAVAHLTISLLVSKMPAAVAQPWLPLPRKVVVAAPWMRVSSEN